MICKLSSYDSFELTATSHGEVDPELNMFFSRVIFTSMEMEVVDFDLNRVIKLLAPHPKSPSVLAGIDEELLGYASVVDRGFHLAVKLYKENMKRASAQDALLIEDKAALANALPTGPANAPNPSFFAKGIQSVGLGYFVNSTYEVIQSLSTRLKLAFKGDFAARQFCPNRVYWLMAINALEANRISEEKEKIQLAINALNADLIYLKNLNQTDLALEKKLEQLNKLKAVL